MTLWTLDEGREAVVTSARSVLDHASCERHDRYFLLWGAGRIEGLDPTDQALGLGHRAVLDNMIELGYASEAVDELEGLCAEAGYDEENYDTNVRRSPW
jgi:hypothetical protein